MPGSTHRTARDTHTRPLRTRLALHAAADHHHHHHHHHIRRHHTINTSSLATCLHTSSSIYIPPLIPTLRSNPHILQIPHPSVSTRVASCRYKRPPSSIIRLPQKSSRQDTRDTASHSCRLGLAAPCLLRAPVASIKPAPPAPSSVAVSDAGREHQTLPDVRATDTRTHARVQAKEQASAPKGKSSYLRQAFFSSPAAPSFPRNCLLFPGNSSHSITSLSEMGLAGEHKSAWRRTRRAGTTADRAGWRTIGCHDCRSSCGQTSRLPIRLHRRRVAAQRIIVAAHHHLRDDP